MFRRLFMLLRSWFGAGSDKLDDPELLLTQAQEEMTVMHAKNRERAVRAITQKNNLQIMLDETEKRIRKLEREAEEAEERGEIERAVEIRRSIQSYEQTLALSRQQLEQAIITAEQVKESIKREEIRIREKTAEALALKAQLRNLEIQQQMLRELRDIPEPSSKDARDFLIVIALVMVILILIALLVTGR